jgi:hypothetical protein
MQRMDIQHHTSEHVASFLSEALRIADEADLPEAERIAVLPTLISLLSSKSVQLIPPQPLSLPGLPVLGNGRHQ